MSSEKKSSFGLKICIWKSVNHLTYRITSNHIINYNSTLNLVFNFWPHQSVEPHSIIIYDPDDKKKYNPTSLCNCMIFVLFLFSTILHAFIFTSKC